MSNKLSIAFVHDRLFHYGGAGIVLEQLLVKYANKQEQKTAPIFVLFASEETFFGHNVITALPQRLNHYIVSQQSSSGLLRWLFDYRNMMPFYPFLVWLLRKKIRALAPDHLVVSSFAAVKNIVPSGGLSATKTTLYLHSPMQYIWENYDEYCKKLPPIKKQLFQLSSLYLRTWDKNKRPYDELYANSTYTKECAEKLYGWEGISVRYPTLPTAYREAHTGTGNHEYYLYIGRLVTFVRETDKTIQLCNDLSIPLLIVGTGPDQDYLQSIAGPTITFLGLVDDDKEKIRLLQQAKGVINLAKESCGIVTMEALAVGTPVFGYNAGGTKELMSSTSGILVDDKKTETLEKAMGTFVTSAFDREDIKKKFFDNYDNVGSII